MRLPKNDLLIRAFRKLFRILKAVHALMVIFLSQGARAAHHFYRERKAFQANRWADVRLHLVARLNLLGARRGSRLNRIFEISGCRDVNDLTYESITEHRSYLTDLFEKFPVGDVLDCYKYFRYFGDFRSANFLRIQALHASVRQQMTLPHVVPQALNAALELGKPEVVLEILEKKKIRRRDRQHVKEVKAMAHALLGELSVANKLWCERFQDSDYLFRELINGRSIAVVGPAPTSDEVGSEIDSYDLIVRTNYRIGSNNPVNLYGSRTDISYYNHYRMASDRDEVVTAANALRWTILKSRSDEKKLRGSFPAYVGWTRSAFLPRLIFFNDAAPMSIQTILNDLIRFSPRCIKLFCTNFYNSDKTYNKNYRAVPLQSAAISESLRIHEAFSGLVFVQNFKRAGLCTSDRLTGEVLGLSREEYAENINALYSEFTLPVL